MRFGDKYKETDRELLSRCCTVHGKILKPDRVIGLMDRDLHGNGEQFTGYKGASGAIRWQTYSSIPLEISGHGEQICKLPLKSRV